MGFLEERILHAYQGPIPLLYLGYIDDGFGISDLPEADVAKFLDFFGKFHPSIHFIYIISAFSASLLDLTVTLIPLSLCTSFFYKPTDAHSYLLYISSHPSSCRNSINFSQLLRFRRLCSRDEDIFSFRLLSCLIYSGAVCTQSLSLSLLSNESFLSLVLKLFCPHPNRPLTDLSWLSLTTLTTYQLLKSSGVAFTYYKLSPPLVTFLQTHFWWLLDVTET
jgi:hypothetical protein